MLPRDHKKEEVMRLLNEALLRLMTWARRDEEGQTLVEYGLIIVLVSVALVVALGLFRDDIAAVFSNIGGTLNPTA